MRQQATDTCILICRVITPDPAQHVPFDELSAGFASRALGVVVFFYNRSVVMEKAP